MVAKPTAKSALQTQKMAEDADEPPLPVYHPPADPVWPLIPQVIVESILL